MFTFEFYVGSNLTIEVYIEYQLNPIKRLPNDMVTANTRKNCQCWQRKLRKNVVVSHEVLSM